MRQETQKVPVARLLANLQERLAKNTNDFEVTYQLARVYSMAYSTNLTEVKVTKQAGEPVFGSPGYDAGVPRHVRVFKSPEGRLTALKNLTNAITLYERALVLLKKSTNANERRWMILPTQLGLAWCLDQSGQRDKALDAYRKTLKVAWLLEITGDFNFKEWAEDVWNDVSSGRNPFNNRSRGSIGPGVCYSEEVIGYMLKLLDPKKDAKEIADLHKRKDILNGMGRAITPILVPLQVGSKLAELVDPNAAVAFDLDGSGLSRKWGWITPKAAWLVYDADGEGQITSALQMFGSVSFWVFWTDGYAALGSLDDDADGRLQGPELHGLALWQDQNSNGLSDPGEVRPLAAFGIRAISCDGQTFSGGMKWNPCGVTFDDGSVRPTFDWIATSE